MSWAVVPGLTGSAVLAGTTLGKYSPRGQDYLSLRFTEVGGIETRTSGPAQPGGMTLSTVSPRLGVVIHSS